MPMHLENALAASPIPSLGASSSALQHSNLCSCVPRQIELDLEKQACYLVLI